MYKTKEELLEAYKNWQIDKVSDTLYYIQMRLHRLTEHEGLFSFKALE